MEIRSISSFLDYYEKIRSRTNGVIAVVPPDQLEWTYRPGKYTIGDIIRHIACIERYMYAETIAGRKSSYRGCAVAVAEGYDKVLQLFNSLHNESLSIFSSLSDEDLGRRCITPAGSSITTWKWLRALVEHEVHHRGQLYIYLGMLGVQTPPIFGLTAEEVEATSLR
jgi:uncharacterized damage-inducible protein DinB